MLIEYIFEFQNAFLVSSVSRSVNLAHRVDKVDSLVVKYRQVITLFVPWPNLLVRRC
jgi:hypothetical protein